MREPLAYAAIVLATLTAATTHGAEPVVRAERIELVTRDGAQRALLAADSSGFFLTLMDARGRPVTTVRLNEEPWLAVQDGGGREVAGLGRPKPHHLGK